ncbi:uncharacterized protein [Onthophagus taurus]|uniref:uncharacterized protein n=1 Tax=Onthophagus taurus TaxID=166361 RepID=UPI000C1FF43C|nr:uncharacterized protein LOC111415911 [Onthophagus taurus]
MESSSMAADSVRSLVLVENETYELIDGDGNFYVSKTNLGPTYPTNDPFSNFSNPDLDEQISSLIPPQSNMEPILINDYAKMNFFTQANANVTIYLNTDNGGSFINNDTCINNEVIDLTTNNSNIIDDVKKQPHQKENQDLPEFIDISQLKIPFPEVQLKNKDEEKDKQIISSDITETETGEDDNDVVFVKEYTIHNTTIDEDVVPLDLRSRNEEKDKVVQEPRRNPKRTVQILKEYYSSFKYSPDFYGTGKRKRECCDTKKKLGAILNPPPLLTNENFKEWPVEGMHEKPVYNPTSKKLEIFGKEKKKAPVRKVKEVVKKRTFKKGKRRICKNKIQEEVNEGVSKEFATLTHETLQEVIGYVQQIKDYNSIVKEEKKLINLESLKQLVTDSCVLYSIANDVPQKSVSKYLKTIRKDIKL